MMVRPLKPSDLPSLYSVFDEFARGLPHGYPMGPEDFCGSFTGQPPHLRVWHVLTAESDGEQIGFLRAGIYRSVGDRWSFANPGEGLIFGPFVSPNDSAAGCALIASAVAFLQGRSIRRIIAFDPIESVGAPGFNGGWSGVSERRPHIVALLAQAGLRLRYRELCLYLPSMPAIFAPAVPTPLTLSFEKRDQDRLSVKLYDRGLYAGACHYSRMTPRRACNDEGRRRGYIDGLAIPEDYQGRGLGRLLLLNALKRLAEMGCESVSLTTAADNFKAQNLYFSLGFELVDSCITMAASMDQLGE